MFSPIVDAIRDVGPAFAGLLTRYVESQETQADALVSIALSLQALSINEIAKELESGD